MFMQKKLKIYEQELSTVSRNTLNQATGPLNQATGPPQSDAGVGIGEAGGRH